MSPRSIFCSHYSTEYKKNSRTKTTVFLSQFSKIVPIKIAYLRYAVCGCCLCIKNANCYNSITAPAGIVHWRKTKQTSLPVEKSGNVCYTGIRECCLHTTGGLHLSGTASGRRTFLLCPRRSTAKGVMLHDAFGNFSSSHVACNCGFWYV